MSLVKRGDKNPNLGKVHLTESGAKMGIQGIYIFVFLLEDTFENNFSSASVAGKFFNLHKTNIGIS